jgi:hypothetical protein
MSEQLTLSFESLLFGVPLGILGGILNALFLTWFVFPSFGFRLDNQITILCTLLSSGLIAGAFQGLFIQPRPRPVALWLAASAFGWFTVYGAMQYYSRSHQVSITHELLLGIPIGLLVGLAQWCILQHYLHAAYWWIVSTFSFWTIIWAAGVLSLYALSGPQL